MKMLDDRIFDEMKIDELKNKNSMTAVFIYPAAFAKAMAANVGLTGLEPAASWSRTKRSTN